VQVTGDRCEPRKKAGQLEIKEKGDVKRQMERKNKAVGPERKGNQK